MEVVFVQRSASLLSMKLWLGPVYDCNQPFRSCSSWVGAELSWVGIFMFEILILLLIVGATASAEWGSSYWKSLPVVMEVPALSRRHLVGIFRLKFSFRFWLIYYICDPRKYKAIVTLDWWSILTTRNILRTTRIFYAKAREGWRVIFCL